jgi:hypothetical protein
LKKQVAGVLCGVFLFGGIGLGWFGHKHYTKDLTPTSTLTPTEETRRLQAEQYQKEVASKTLIGKVVETTNKSITITIQESTDESKIGQNATFEVDQTTRLRQIQDDKVKRFYWADMEGRPVNHDITQLIPVDSVVKIIPDGSKAGLIVWDTANRAAVVKNS